MSFTKATTRTIRATVITIGEDLPWEPFDSVLNTPILICEKQRRTRTGKFGTQDEYVCTYRLDDETQEPTARFSTTSQVIVNQLDEIADNELPVAACVKARYKSDGTSVKYYYLAPIELAGVEQAEFPF
jgi:hypothetical protein